MARRAAGLMLKTMIAIEKRALEVLLHRIYELISRSIRTGTEPWSAWVEHTRNEIIALADDEAGECDRCVPPERRVEGV
jgi:hypothetical protein